MQRSCARSAPYIFPSLAHGTEHRFQTGEKREKGVRGKEGSHRHNRRPLLFLLPLAPPRRPLSAPLYTSASGEQAPFPFTALNPPAPGARRFKFPIGGFRGVGARFPAGRIARAGWEVGRRCREVRFVCSPIFSLSCHFVYGTKARTCCGD
jgi:hypothetical protein